MGCDVGFRPRNYGRAFDDTVAELAPGPRGVGDEAREANDKLRAAGVPRSYLDAITIELSRQDLAQLLEFVEQRAVRADNYFEVRQAVLFSELLRGQARKQGF